VRHRAAALTIAFIAAAAMAAKETVLLYATDSYRRITPVLRQLRGFQVEYEQLMITCRFHGSNLVQMHCGFLADVQSGKKIQSPARSCGW
jgi:hypothetical protein